MHYGLWLQMFFWNIIQAGCPFLWHRKVWGCTVTTMFSSQRKNRAELSIGKYLFDLIDHKEIILILFLNKSYLTRGKRKREQDDSTRNRNLTFHPKLDSPLQIINVNILNVGWCTWIKWESISALC